MRSAYLSLLPAESRERSPRGVESLNESLYWEDRTTSMAFTKSSFLTTPCSDKFDNRLAPGVLTDAFTNTPSKHRDRPYVTCPTALPQSHYRRTNKSFDGSPPSLFFHATTSPFQTHRRRPASTLRRHDAQSPHGMHMRARTRRFRWQ